MGDPSRLRSRAWAWVWADSHQVGGIWDCTGDFSSFAFMKSHPPSPDGETRSWWIIGSCPSTGVQPLPLMCSCTWHGGKKTLSLRALYFSEPFFLFPSLFRASAWRGTTNSKLFRVGLRHHLRQGGGAEEITLNLRARSTHQGLFEGLSDHHLYVYQCFETLKKTWTEKVRLATFHTFMTYVTLAKAASQWRVSLSQRFGLLESCHVGEVAMRTSQCLTPSDQGQAFISFELNLWPSPCFLFFLCIGAHSRVKGECCDEIKAVRSCLRSTFYQQTLVRRLSRHKDHYQFIRHRDGAKYNHVCSMIDVYGCWQSQHCLRSTRLALPKCVLFCKFSAKNRSRFLLLRPKKTTRRRRME